MFFESLFAENTQDRSPVCCKLGNSISELGGLTLNSVQAKLKQGVELEKCFTSMFRLGTEVDLKTLKNGIRCSNLSSSGKMLIGKLRDPSRTFTIFSSGACIITFAKSYDDSLMGARKTANLVKKLGYNVKFNHFQILNVSYRFSLGKEVEFENLKSLFKSYKTYYEPELQEELIIKIEETSCYFSQDGSVVITGAKSENQAEFVYNVIMYTINTDFSQSSCVESKETDDEEFFRSIEDEDQKCYE